MRNLNVELLCGVDLYFNTLHKLGYVSYSEVEKLLAALFLGEIVDGLFGNLLTEEEYTAIAKALTCLYGSTCLLPYNIYTERFKPLKNTLFNTILRTTEDEIIRISEKGKSRAIR